LTRNRTNPAEEPGTFADGGEDRPSGGVVEAASNQPDRTQEGPQSGREDSNQDWKDRYMRLLADFENYKRHAEAQREQLSGIGKAKVLEDVFPLVEHMERAIRAARDANDRTGILEGVEMVYRELLNVLEKHGVERVETVGRRFDPQIHEAVAVSPYPEGPAGTIVEEVRAGFLKDGKLLRPASVVVSQ